VVKLKINFIKEHIMAITVFNTSFAKIIRGARYIYFGRWAQLCSQSGVTAGYIMSDAERLRKTMQQIADFLLNHMQ